MKQTYNQTFKTAPNVKPYIVMEPLLIKKYFVETPLFTK